MKTINRYQYQNFDLFVTALITEAGKSNFCDFKKNHDVVSQRTTRFSAWPVKDITLTSTKPVTPLTQLDKGKTHTVLLRDFLNLVQLAKPKAADYKVKGVHRSGYIWIEAVKDIKAGSTTVTPPPVTTPKLAFTTNLKATAKLGDKLSVEWSGGVAPYQVEVQADTVSIVDFVDVGSVTKYDYDTTGKKAGTYQISVKDDKGSVIGSVQSVVS